MRSFTTPPAPTKLEAPVVIEPERIVSVGVRIDVFSVVQTFVVGFKISMRCDVLMPVRLLSTDQSMRLAVAATRFWGARGYVSEGRAWFQQILADRTGVALATVAKALNAAGFLSFRQSDFDEAVTLFNQGLALFQQIEDEQGIAEVLQNLAAVEIPQAKFALAQQHLEQSLAICRQLQDEYGIARVQQHLGHLAYDQDRFAEAHAYFVESLASYRALGDQLRIANLLLNLGSTVKQLGDTAAAQRYHQECLAIGRAIGHQGLIGATLRTLGLQALEQNDYAQARRYGEESLQMMRSIGDKSNSAFALKLLGNVARQVGESQQALAYYCRNLQIMVELNYRWPIYDVLERMASLLFEIAQHPQTVVLFLGVADAIRRELGNALSEAEATEMTQKITTLRQQLGDSAFAALWSAATTTPLDAVVATANQLVLD